MRGPYPYQTSAVILIQNRKNNNVANPYCAQNPSYCIGGALGSNYYTSNGTFNGTGIAIAGESWNNEERKIMTLYFQHWTGEIRWTQLTPKGEWIGGTKSEVIITDAKNSTPISTVAYAINGIAQVSCSVVGAFHGLILTFSL